MGRPRRDIEAEAEAATIPPDTLTDKQFIAQIIKGQGNSLFTVSLPSKKQILVELAPKLRNTFWLKRGKFVLVDESGIADRDNKLAGEICRVILKEKEWRKMPHWPSEFTKNSNAYQIDSDDEEDRAGQLPPSYSDVEEEEENAYDGESAKKDDQN